MAKISSALNISSVQMQEQLLAPTTAASGYGKLYCKGDGVYFIDDSGVQVGPLVGIGSLTSTVKGARVYNSSGITVSNNQYPYLTFDSERYDTDTIHDTGSNTGRLTCKTAGKYLISATLGWNSNSSGIRCAYIVLNRDKAIASQTIAAVNGDSTRLTISTIYDLAINDYVEVQTFQNSGGDRIITADGNNSPEFMMHRLDNLPYNSGISYNAGGWVTGDSMTYASADSPTFTMTCVGDLTSKYSVGMRIKLTQTTVKYFIITAISYGAPNTTITLYGGTDYSLANAAISDVYYSSAKAPYGFPLDPTKWTVETLNTSDVTQASPVNDTWYNLGTVNISIPIGAWRVRYSCAFLMTGGSSQNRYGQVALSTANNSASDSELVTTMDMNAVTNGIANMVAEKHLTLASKTTYYLNAVAKSTSTGLYFYASSASQKTIIRATCAYL